MTEAVTSRPRRRPAQSGGWRVVADAVRGLAALSVVVAGWRTGAAGAALLLIVLAGTVVPRRVAAPGALDAAYCAALLLAAWAGELGWYEAVGWLDLAVHAVTTGLVAAVALAVLVHAGAVGPSAVPRARLGTGVLVVGIGALGSILWELAEWYGWTAFDPTIHVGYTDTLGDLAAGVVGSLVAAALVARGPLARGTRA